MISTTLNNIWAAHQDRALAKKLLETLGDQWHWDSPIAYADLVTYVGVYQAARCMAAEPQHQRVWDLFNALCLNELRPHLGKQSLEAITVLEEFNLHADTARRESALGQAKYGVELLHLKKYRGGVTKYRGLDFRLAIYAAEAVVTALTTNLSHLTSWKCANVMIEKSEKTRLEASQEDLGTETIGAKVMSIITEKFIDSLTLAESMTNEPIDEQRARNRIS